MPVVQIAQHALQGLTARQAGGEPGLIQLESGREAPQRRVQVVARGPLLHLLIQPVMHGPELALLPGTCRRRGRHGGVRMHPQREVFDDPPNLSGLDKPLI